MQPFIQTSIWEASISDPIEFVPIKKKKKSTRIPSCQMPYIKQWGITFQIYMHQCQLKPPCQQANNSITPLGITHWTPKKAKNHSPQLSDNWQ